MTDYHSNYHILLWSNTLHIPQLKVKFTSNTPTKKESFLFNQSHRVLRITVGHDTILVSHSASHPENK